MSTLQLIQMNTKGLGGSDKDIGSAPARGKRCSNHLHKPFHSPRPFPQSLTTSATHNLRSEISETTACEVSKSQKIVIKTKTKPHRRL